MSILNLRKCPIMPIIPSPLTTNTLTDSMTNGRLPTFRDAHVNYNVILSHLNTTDNTNSNNNNNNNMWYKMLYFNAIKVSDMFKLKLHLQIHNI